MKAITYLLVFLLTIVVKGQNSEDLDKLLWKRVQNCYSLFEDENEDGVPDYNEIDDSKNGYLRVWGSYPTCGCECNSIVGAYKNSHGDYMLLQKEEFFCDWNKSISSNKDMDEILPENFDINVFSESKSIENSKYAVFFLDVEIPRIGTDTKFTLKLIPFGILKEEEGSAITKSYSQYNLEKEGQSIAPRLIHEIKSMVTKMTNQKTLSYLLKKEYDSININDKRYIKHKILGGDSSGSFESFDDLTEQLNILKNAYDIYSRLDYMSVLMQWNKGKGRFEIKSMCDKPKNLSFKEFILANEYWTPIC